MNEMIMDHDGFQKFLDILHEEGYCIIGPTTRDHVIVYDVIRFLSDLPVGIRDHQEAGTYRLEETGLKTLFNYVPGPYSWKRYLHPPEIRLWRAYQEGQGFRVVEEDGEDPKYAFVGVRSCELRAIGILDRVFNTNGFTDPIYNARRKNVLVVAVNCTRPGGTCFCSSMNTGPKATSGFDMVLTEIPANGHYELLAQAGSERGVEILKKIVCREADPKEIDMASDLLKKACDRMGRRLTSTNFDTIFSDNFEHPQWESVAKTCLSCGNCTMVCPTCFCFNIEDVNDLEGHYAERWRKWDSCFSENFSYIHGGSIRFSSKSRYRQWLTHKFSTWVDQFGTPGCVGCGRCITWCPVGIDITQEVNKIMG